MNQEQSDLSRFFEQIEAYYEDLSRPARADDPADRPPNSLSEEQVSQLADDLREQPDEPEAVN